MSRRRIVFMVLLLGLGPGLAACGSGGSRGADSVPESPGPGTQLRITGAASGSPAAPPPGSPTPIPPTSIPSAPAERQFSGTLRCAASQSSGTGMFTANAAAACGRIADDPKLFEAVGPRSDRMCTEIYGGPQHARIVGTVAGAPVDVTITRTDGCGIADWEQLEWLLGPPG